MTEDKTQTEFYTSSTKLTKLLESEFSDSLCLKKFEYFMALYDVFYNKDQNSREYFVKLMDRDNLITSDIFPGYKSLDVVLDVLTPNTKIVKITMSDKAKERIRRSIEKRIAEVKLRKDPERREYFMKTIRAKSA